jgi:hypothetical protein
MCRCTAPLGEIAACDACSDGSALMQSAVIELLPHPQVGLFSNLQDSWAATPVTVACDVVTSATAMPR